jgi:hypothetical protein
MNWEGLAQDRQAVLDALRRSPKVKKPAEKRLLRAWLEAINEALRKGDLQ